MKFLAIETLGDFDCTVTHIYMGGVLSPAASLVLSELNLYIDKPLIDERGYQMNCRSSSEQRDLFELFDSIIKGYGYKEFSPPSISIGE